MTNSETGLKRKWNECQIGLLHWKRECRKMYDKNIEPLVSVITPCYNGANYLEGYFEGILRQTYRTLEIIFVNDGSTDETERIATKWGERLQEEGMNFIYIRQENRGVAAAINQGLAQFTGEFMTWLDSDDIMMPENIEKKLDYLLTHPEKGFVLNEAMVVDAKEQDKRIWSMKRIRPDGEDRLFDDLIHGRNVVWVPGTCLVRRTCIEEAIPSMRIYESREGQNWQLMLPLAWHAECGYIEEELLKCVQHSDSHSRFHRSISERIQREKNFIILCTETVNAIPDMIEDEKEKWRREIRLDHENRILNIMAGHNPRAFIKVSKEMKKDGFDRQIRNSYLWLTAKKIIRKGNRTIKRLSRWIVKKAGDHK